MHRTTCLAKPVFASLVLVGLASVTLPGPAAAQSFGFLFDRPAHRPTRAFRRRPVRTAVAVPLPVPVPRPHFAEDTAGKPPSSAAAASTPATSSAPTPSELNATPLDGKAAEAPKAASNEPVKAPIAPSGADTGFNPRQVPVDDGCPGRLAAGDVGADAVAIGPQPDARCAVVQPVRLSGMTLADGLKVTFPDRPTIACETADTFARYVRELLVPLAKGSYGSPIDAVWTGPGLECRARDHVRGAKLSAHGQGLAIDIAQLKLTDGRRIEVGDPRTPTDQGFETAARAAACGYFHTTLGPGSDSYHRNHWHFDLEQRGRTGDTKYCK